MKDSRLGLACLATTVLLSASLTAAAADHDDVRASAERMQQRIDELSQFGANPEGGVSRVAFSQADIDGRAHLRQWMLELGLDVHVDAAGNMTGRRAGTDNDLPPIMFGSHIDSVPGGGNYDGQVGVAAALEVIGLLNEHEITTRHPLEVINFTDEEGGLTGSRAIIGKLTDAALDVQTHSGLTIGEGIRAVGGDPDRLHEAVRSPGDIKAFVEMHIEQGAFLAEDGINIGVVEGIVGIRWWTITVEGMANHAGTTPMNRRRDAMLTAARIVLAVNDVANDLDGRQVATVGKIEAFPGAPNVIPGKVEMALEIRDLDSAMMQRVFDLIKAEAQRIADDDETTVRFDEIDVASPPAPTDMRLRAVITSVAKGLGFSFRHMPSGAGHDAQDMAQITPTGMIFVPSVGGISHSPKEFTSAEDMANGASVLFHTILALDNEEL